MKTATLVLGLFIGMVCLAVLYLSQAGILTFVQF